MAAVFASTDTTIKDHEFFWSDLGLAKSIFYTGIGWSEDLEILCNKLDIPGDAIIELKKILVPGDCAEFYFDDAAVKTIGDEFPLLKKQCRENDCFMQWIGSNMHPDILKALRTAGPDMARFIAALSEGIRGSRLPTQIQDRTITYLENTFLPYAHIPAKRMSAILAVALSDARRWLAVCGYEDQDKFVDLQDALDKEHKRVDQLSKVINAAGLTESGRRVAVSTVDDCSFGTSTTSVVSGHMIEPARIVRDVDLESAATLYGNYVNSLSLGQEAEPHPTYEEFYQALIIDCDYRIIRHALDWLRLQVAVCDCDRHTGGAAGKQQHLLSKTITQMIKACKVILRKTKPATKESKKLAQSLHDCLTCL